MKHSGKSLCALICLIALAYSQQTLAASYQQDTKPITKDNLISSIELGRREKKTAASYIGLINRYGVAFRLTLDDEKEIRRVGAYFGRKGLDNLITVVRSNYRVYETDIRGLLTPANDPDPSSSCTSSPLNDPNAVGIFFGSSAAWITIPKHIVLKIKESELLSISRSKEGVRVSAEIYSKDGRIVAQIIDNEFHINPNNYFRIDRQDRHSLVVYDQYKNQVLSVRFLNPHAIKVIGIFYYHYGPPVFIGEQEVRIGERTISTLCNWNTSISMYFS